MGYYSEVSITLRNDDFLSLVNKTKIENTEAFDLIIDANIYRNDEFTTLYWDWIKWYDDSKLVRYINDFIQDVPYVYNRLGEDNSDFEYIENFDENNDMDNCVELIRRLSINNAGELYDIKKGIR
jgi:hypothetical protein